MKNNVFLSLIILILTACQNSVNQKQAKIKVDNDVVNLGQVNAIDTIKTSFYACNIGGDTLFITKIGVSCGCTNGHSDKDFVLPGDSAKINVTYTPTNDVDSVQKSIIIENNSAEPFKLVYIKAFVKR